MWLQLGATVCTSLPDVIEDHVLFVNGSSSLSSFCGTPLYCRDSMHRTRHWSPAPTNTSHMRHAIGEGLILDIPPIPNSDLCGLKSTLIRITTGPVLGTIAQATVCPEDIRNNDASKCNCAVHRSKALFLRNPHPPVVSTLSSRVTMLRKTGAPYYMQCCYVFASACLRCQCHYSSTELTRIAPLRVLFPGILIQLLHQNNSDNDSWVTSPFSILDDDV